MIERRLTTVCPFCGKPNLYKYKAGRGYKCRTCGNTFMKPTVRPIEYRFSGIPYGLARILEEKRASKQLALLEQC